MSGRLQDVWQYVWPEIWLALEQSPVWPQLAEGLGFTTEQLYMDLYVELAKALKKAPQPEIYDLTANDPTLARLALEKTPAASLRCESATARFFENAFDVISEAGSAELENAFRQLLHRFLRSRNLRYELSEPFRLQSHLPGVFSALFSDLVATSRQSPQLQQAMADFEHAFRALEKSQLEVDVKTCILKATMLVEALASAAPNAKGKTLGDICDSLSCWPHVALKEAVKRIYGFCSDYPGIRHNVGTGGQIRALGVNDSIIVPLLLLTAAGYFGPNANMLDTFRSQAFEPKQEPPDPPVMAEPQVSAAVP
ncbi:MAG: hypothetical protein ACYC23_18255 [Limisphaerales bacterium]